MYSSRRDLLKIALLGSSGMLTSSLAGAAPPSRPALAASVHWIDRAPPPLHAGQTFGVAWPRGAVKRRTRLAVRTAAGEPVPSQSWVNATWPDGSVKWSAHAIPPTRRRRS